MRLNQARNLITSIQQQLMQLQIAIKPTERKVHKFEQYLGVPAPDDLREQLQRARDEITEYTMRLQLARAEYRHAYLESIVGRLPCHETSMMRAARKAGLIGPDYQLA